MAKLKCPPKNLIELGKIVYECATNPRVPAADMEKELADHLYRLEVQVVENGTRRRFDPERDKIKLCFDNVSKGQTTTALMMPTAQDISEVLPSSEEEDEYYHYIGSYYLSRCR